LTISILPDIFTVQIAESCETAWPGRPPAVTGGDGSGTVRIIEEISRCGRPAWGVRARPIPARRKLRMHKNMIIIPVHLE
jgi:hypothetical protein